MNGSLGGKRFLQTTQGRIVVALRAGDRTVDELAAGLGITGNAVRGHLAALTRDGLVEPRGRRPRLRKPAVEFGLTAEAERRLSRAYLPLLKALLAALAARASRAELLALLEEAGHRLAEGVPRPAGDFAARSRAAADALVSLGGAVTTERRGGRVILRGAACPLAEVVSSHPAVCHAVETLLHEIVGVGVTEHCERGERPRCLFEILERPRGR